MNKRWIHIGSTTQDLAKSWAKGALGCLWKPGHPVRWEQGGHASQVAPLLVQWAWTLLPGLSTGQEWAEVRSCSPSTANHMGRQAQSQAAKHSLDWLPLEMCGYSCRHHLEIRSLAPCTYLESQNPNSPSSLQKNRVNDVVLALS